jgi:IclR family acetate operon transcriptional repressor
LLLQEIAAYTGLHPSKTYRLLNTLISVGFVIHQPDRRYRLGLQAFEVGSGFVRRSPIRRAALSFLMKLAEQTRLTVNLGFWHVNKAVILDSLPMPGMYQFYEMGSAVPAHASALGKVLLAFQSDFDLARVEPLHQFTENTIHTIPRLQEELVRIVHDGYAIDDEECLPGCRCVAAPILHDRTDPIAAISLTGPTAILETDRISELVTPLKERCWNISIQLGNRPSGASADPLGNRQRITHEKRRG